MNSFFVAMGDAAKTKEEYDRVVQVQREEDRKWRERARPTESDVSYAKWRYGADAEKVLLYYENFRRHPTLPINPDWHDMRIVDMAREMVARRARGPVTPKSPDEARKANLARLEARKWKPGR